MEKEILFGKEKWMFESIFGVDYVEECVKQNKSIEQIMNEYEDLFSTGEKDNRKFLISKGHENYAEYLKVENIRGITNLEAFILFGIEVMETAREKVYAYIYI